MIEPGQTYWLVNKPAEVSAAGLDTYLSQNRWVPPKPEKSRSALARMQPGDPIACKSVTWRSRDLPFFAADNPASVMTVHAVGAVTSVDPNTGTVDVAWEPTPSGREWYLWTSAHTIWAVTPGEHAMSDDMLRFAFDGGSQDFGPYLSDRYWKPRFAPLPGFTWIPFYEEVATRLLAFRDDPADLAARLVTLSETVPNLGYLVSDQFADGGSGPIREIDPFTVMGAFNRGLTDDNRLTVAQGIASVLGVSHPLPTDFDGIPILNNQKSWFISYSRDRRPDDVPTLWRMFAAAVAYADAASPERHAEFADAYNDSLRVRGVKWNLSQGLYWVRPRSYVTLDGPSRDYLASRWGLAAPTDGEGYLKALDVLGRRMRGGSTSITSFPELSYAAWIAAKAHEVPHSMAGLAHWAARLGESMDQDAVENDYKRHAAELARRARDDARSGDPGWAATLKKALVATNTIHFMYADNVNKAIASNPQEMQQALELVWSSPEPASLDALSAALQGLVPKSTPGNVTALGALLLSAEDVEGNAPYSTERAHRWFQLTGFEGTTSGTPGARYASLLAFLDQLRDELADRHGLEASRLEAQGLAWSTTESAPPEDWSKDERSSLETWRAGGSEPARAWLVRPKHGSVATWLADGYVALAASHLPKVPAGADLKTVTKAVEAGYQHVDYAQRQALAAEYHAFLSRMRPGDVVVTHAQERVHAGRITGEPRYASGSEERLRRTVDWASSMARADLPAGLGDLLELQGTVVDLTDAFEQLDDLIETGPPVDQPEVIPVDHGLEVTKPDEPLELVLPPVTEALATSLHADVAPLQEIVDLLATRKQVVLYGPPGTGKTYIAMALARHLVGEENGSHRQLVQFHPSYAYEDFFEGFRPHETDTGQATFRILPGPLRLIASQARANPNRPFVLIIDEMNRANLAKVFGELYFLLEYRDRSIQLQYSPTEAFKLPENLFIIGTMNTADRSIALLDAAMRRRFAFIELHPDEPPVRDILARYVAATGHPGDLRGALLTVLNDEIEDTDRDFKIGPSYLMRQEAATQVGLERIWKHDILPLLEEHYYGRLTRPQVHERFGLASLQAGLVRPPEGAMSAMEDADAEPAPSHGEEVEPEPDAEPVASI
jgi:DNA polymerase III delta prime subunit